MTPWQRVDSELSRRKTSWFSMGEALGLKKQNIGHWKNRGIPAKYIRPIAVYLGWSTEKVEFGDDLSEPVKEDHLTKDRSPADSMSQTLARLFDTLPNDAVLRADVFTACSNEIKKARESPKLNEGVPELPRKPRKAA